MGETGQVDDSMRKRLDIAMAIALIRNLHKKGMISEEILISADKKVQKLLDSTENV